MRTIRRLGRAAKTMHPMAAASLVGSFMLGLIVVNGIAVPPPAVASTCSEKTGGDNDRLIKANNSSTGSTGWNCAYVYSTGDTAIGPLDSAVVEDVSANGYQRVYDCMYESSGGISIYRTYVDGGGKIGSSMTWSTSNSNDGTRHWTGAILWMTKTNSSDPYPGQYLANCDGYTISYNAMWETDLSWSATQPAGSKLTTGTVVPVTLKLNGEGKNPPDSTLYVFQSTDPNSTADDTVIAYGKTSNDSVTINVKLPTEGNIDLWGAYGGTSWQTATPPSDNFLGALTGTTSYYVYNPVPYATKTTLSMPSNVGVGMAANASITVTTPANPMAAKPNGIPVTLYQQIGSTEDTTVDLKVGTATLVNGAASMSVTPSAFGNYKYYVSFPGLLGSGSSAPPAQYNPSLSTAAAVSADYSCTTSTGSTHPTKIKANNSSNDPATGFNCAYLQGTGKDKVNAGQSYTSTKTADAGFAEAASCYVTDGPVSVKTSASLPGITPVSRSWTATNSDWSKTGYWGGSVLWMAQQNSTAPLAGQYSTSCSSSTYSLSVNLLADPTVSLTVPSGVKAGTASNATVSVTTNPVVTVSGAAVNVFQMLGTKPASSDPKVGSGTVTSNAATVSITPQTGALAFYAVMDPSNYASAPLLASGWTGWASGISAIEGPAYASSTAVTRAVDITPRPAGAAGPSAVAGLMWSESAPVSTAAKSWAVSTKEKPGLVTPIVVQQQGKGDLSVSCPTGTVVQNFFAGSPKTTFGPDKIAVGSDGRVSLANKGGHRAMLQVSCRPATADAAISGRNGQGSARADVMTTVTNGSIFLGGPGNDRLTASHRDSTLAGGLGADILIAKAPGAVLIGGPQDDTLRANGGRALLNGGAGRDTFEAGDGVVFINAKDGRGGDTIQCTSAKNQYLADAGDIVRGPCTPLAN